MNDLKTHCSNTKNQINKTGIMRINQAGKVLDLVGTCTAAWILE
jgi:hypothetical protein